MSESVAPIEVEAKAKKGGPAPRKLAPLDWVLVLVSGNLSVFLMGSALVTGTFRAMFEDFGGTIPLLTRLVARWYTPVLAGLAVAGLLGFALLRAKPERRRAFLGGAAALGALSLAAFLYGLYWPIFAISGQIKP